MSYIVNDCVHNIFSLPSYVSDIINTKEFQRLYHLKQLGKQHCMNDQNVFKSNLFSQALQATSSSRRYIQERNIVLERLFCVSDCSTYSNKILIKRLTSYTENV